MALADHEAEPVGEWLNSLGITAWVLRYRLHPHYRHPAMLHDAARAVRTARFRTAELGLDAERVGILGFSAGGHLASSLATHFDAGRQSHADPVEQCSCRPDLAVLVYPVITMYPPHAHEGSRYALLGENPSAELIELMSSEKQVTSQTPPVFQVYTADDSVQAENSLLMAQALLACKVPNELHMYEAGAHGYGLGNLSAPFVTWTDQCAHWMRTRGFLG